MGTGQRDGRRDRGTAASRGRARPGVRGAGPGRAVAGGGRRRGAAGGRRWVPGRSGAPVPPRRYPACGEARPAAAALRPPRAAAAPTPPLPLLARSLFGEAGWAQDPCRGCAAARTPLGRGERGQSLLPRGRVSRCRQVNLGRGAPPRFPRRCPCVFVCARVRADYSNFEGDVATGQSVRGGPC